MARFSLAAILAVAVFSTQLCPAVAGTSALKPIDHRSLQSVVDATAKELLVPGAVVLLRTPQGEFVITYGTTQLGTMNAPSINTHFRIASNAKTMLAAVILQQAQEGKLRLNDHVSRYVRNIPNGDKITVENLLQMRSGLYNYTNSAVSSASLDRNPTRAWTPNEILAISFKHPPSASPGTEFEYNNTNYVLLGLIAERIDRKPLAAIERDRLFVPLGMKQTEIPPRTVIALPQPYSHGYMYGSTSVALVGKPPYSAEVKAAAHSGKLKPHDYTNLNHSFVFGAGGVVSTADDLAIWIPALVTGRVLNAAYQHRWLNSLQPEDPSKPKGQLYGYGIAGLRFGPNTIYFHGGETAGYNSFIGCDPKNNETLVVWTNLTVSPDAGEQQTANAIMLRVLDTIYTISPLTKS